MGGLGAWMPTYFVRERGLSVAAAGTIFGALLLVAGFLGTIVGGQLGDRLARRFPDAHFSFSGWALIASLPFTMAAVLARAPAVFWPGLFVTMLLLFANMGPLNAAMVNVLPPDLRARGVGLHTTTIHLLGDALSPFLIGVVSDSVGLRIPRTAQRPASLPVRPGAAHRSTTAGGRPRGPSSTPACADLISF